MKLLDICHLLDTGLAIRYIPRCNKFRVYLIEVDIKDGEASSADTIEQAIRHYVHFISGKRLVYKAVEFTVPEDLEMGDFITGVFR